jgi:uncharacterized protein YbbC (DUF1343 family)
MTLTLEQENQVSNKSRNTHHVTLGLEKLLEGHADLVKGARVGLICNQASVNHGYQHAADLFHKHPDINLRTLFGPNTAFGATSRTT